MVVCSGQCFLFGTWVLLHKLIFVSHVELNCFVSEGTLSLGAAVHPGGTSTAVFLNRTLVSTSLSAY